MDISKVAETSSNRNTNEILSPWEEAKRIVSENFQDHSSLEEMAYLKLDYQRKLDATKHQLQTIVHSKLNGVHQAMDLLSQSGTKVDGLRDRFKQMDEYGSQATKLVGGLDQLKKIHRAHHNLTTTVNQVKFLATLPEKVQTLKEQLRTEPLKIKSIYSESQKFHHWRQQMLKEYEKLRQRKSFREGGLSLPTLLQPVEDLTAAVKTTIEKNIEGCITIAVKNPAVLVKTFEIIELHEATEGPGLRKAMQQKGLEYGFKDRKKLGELFDIPMLFRDDALIALANAAQIRGQTLFAGVVQEAAKKKNIISSSLEGGTGLLLDLENIRLSTMHCFPPEYDAMGIFAHEYTQCMENQILGRFPDQASFENETDLFEQLNDEIDLGTIMESIRWLGIFETEMMSRFEMKSEADQLILKKFSDMSKSLLDDYIKKMRKQLSNWFRNIENREREIKPNMDGQLITFDPEDMFNIIHVEVDVAKEYLSGDSLGLTLDTCLQVLLEMQQETDTRLKNWRSLEVEDLCAYCNDYFRLQGLADDYIEDFHLKLSDTEQAAVREMSYGVAKGFARLADEANTCICKTILHDVEEAEFFNGLFTAQWMSGEDQCVTTTLKTFEDYFPDLQSWLLETSFSKLVLKCYNGLVVKWVEKLMTVKARTFRANEYGYVKNQIDKEAQEMMSFFKGFKNNLLQAGMGKIEPVQVLMHIKAVLTAARLLPAPGTASSMGLMNRGLNSVEDSLKFLLQEFQHSTGAEPVEMVMHTISVGDRQAEDTEAILTRLKEFEDQILGAGSPQHHKVQRAYTIQMQQSGPSPIPAPSFPKFQTSAKAFSKKIESKNPFNVS